MGIFLKKIKLRFVLKKSSRELDHASTGVLKLNCASTGGLRTTKEAQNGPLRLYEPIPLFYVPRVVSAGKNLDALNLRGMKNNRHLRSFFSKSNCYLIVYMTYWRINHYVQPVKNPIYYVQKMKQYWKLKLVTVCDFSY